MDGKIPMQNGNDHFLQYSVVKTAVDISTSIRQIACMKKILLIGTTIMSITTLNRAVAD